jgi:hypothetical protein
MAFGKRNFKISHSKDYRSGLEEKVQEDLKQASIDAEYESIKIEWEDLCYRKYTPDFLLPNGIIIETKGQFTAKDRRKHVLVKEQHPHLDIRFVFTRSNSRLSKQSKTTYADWCIKQGFLYADKKIPEDWLIEKPKKEMPLKFNPYKGTKHD